MLVVLPSIVEPVMVTLLDTSTPMYCGTVSGGGGLLPPVVVHADPQAAGGVLVGKVTFSAKPLNAGGAAPPDGAFAADQLCPHHSTVPPDMALASLTTNAPLLGNAKTIAVSASDEPR